MIVISQLNLRSNFRDNRGYHRNTLPREQTCSNHCSWKGDAVFLVPPAETIRFKLGITTEASQIWACMVATETSAAWIKNSNKTTQRSSFDLWLLEFSEAVKPYLSKAGSDAGCDIFFSLSPSNRNVWLLCVPCFAHPWFKRIWPEQGRNEVRWRPGHEASLAPPCSKLRSFEANVLCWRKYLWQCWDFSASAAVIWRLQVTRRRGIASPCPLRYAPGPETCVWYLVSVVGDDSLFFFIHFIFSPDSNSSECRAG